MNFTLRSSSHSSTENDRLTRKHQTTTFNRFLSFNENKSSSVENRRRLLQSTPNLIELLEEDEDDIEDTQALCHECNICSKLFASEYGLNHHINMYHPNQSILCTLCNITFASHRSLKTHQQRRHSSSHIKSKSNHSTLPNYNYISSYLFLAFTSEQFPITANTACEQQRLPLGHFSSKLYQCQICSTSFPCIRTLNYHLLNTHEQFEYKICEKILSDIIVKVELNLRTVKNDDDDDIELMKLNLAQQASQFGLIDKQLNKKFRSNKAKQNHFIYPRCQHKNRTCANLCLEYLSSYSELINNYPYSIPIRPKGNPFAQGSIVSSITNIYSNDSTSVNEINLSNDLTNGRQKRKSIKQTDDSSSPQLKKKFSTNLTTINSKTNRTNSNNKFSPIKQQIDTITKTNETKFISIEQSSVTVTVTSSSSTLPRKILPKDNYMRSTSLSSNSTTTTRSSTLKLCSSSTNLTQQSQITSQRSAKRSLSPSIAKSSERLSQKRCRSREQKGKTNSSSTTKIIKIDDENNIEQENDEEEDEDEEDEEEEDLVPIRFEQPKQPKQRQPSSGSIEYVQIFDNEQQLPSSSLNNIENIKSKSKINDDEIIICRSPPSIKKVTSSTNKNHSKTTSNSSRKSNIQQSSDNEEHVRVRCKICGEILEGRSRFSKHVMTMHSHLLNKTLSESKQQTAIVR